MKTLKGGLSSSSGPGLAVRCSECGMVTLIESKNEIKEKKDWHYVNCSVCDAPVYFPRKSPSLPKESSPKTGCSGKCSGCKKGSC